VTAAAKESGGRAEMPAGDAVPYPLWDYLERLGVRDETLRESLARECLVQARRAMGDGAEEQLVARALEEVQRRLDRALAKGLGLNPIRDAARIAGLRAALLMCTHGISADFLFHGLEAEGGTDQIARLVACLPRATPPEAQLAMPPQALEFLFFKSA